MSSKYKLRLYEASWVRRLIWDFSGSTCHFVGFAVHRLSYSCDSRLFKCRLWFKCFQAWITHKARKIILILNQIAVLTHPYIFIRLGDYGQDTIFVKARWCINQEIESCLSCSQHTVLIRYTYLWSFVTIFLKGLKLWPLNNSLPRIDNSTVKIKDYRFCLFHMVLMRYIFPGSFLKFAKIYPKRL